MVSLQGTESHSVQLQCNIIHRKGVGESSRNVLQETQLGHMWRGSHQAALLFSLSPCGFSASLCSACQYQSPSARQLLRQHSCLSLVHFLPAAVFVFFFFEYFFLSWWNIHKIKFTIFKCTIQAHYIYSPGYATISTMYFQNISHYSR